MQESGIESRCMESERMQQSRRRSQSGKTWEFAIFTQGEGGEEKFSRGILTGKQFIDKFHISNYY